MPTKAHAANYLAVRHYLDAIEAAGSKEPMAVMAKMRALPIDFFGKPARMREDGRIVYDLDLFQVKTPQESKAPYDYYKHIRTITADEAFPPPNREACSMLGAK